MKCSSCGSEAAPSESRTCFQCPKCRGVFFEVGVGGTLKCASRHQQNHTIGCGWEGNAPVTLVDGRCHRCTAAECAEKDAALNKCISISEEAKKWEEAARIHKQNHYDSCRTNDKLRHKLNACEAGAAALREAAEFSRDMIWCAFSEENAPVEIKGAMSKLVYVLKSIDAGREVLEHLQRAQSEAAQWKQVAATSQSAAVQRSKEDASNFEALAETKRMLETSLKQLKDDVEGFKQLSRVAADVNAAIYRERDELREKLQKSEASAAQLREALRVTELAMLNHAGWVQKSEDGKKIPITRPSDVIEAEKSITAAIATGAGREFLERLHKAEESIRNLVAGNVESKRQLGKWIDSHAAANLCAAHTGVPLSKCPVCAFENERKAIKLTALCDQHHGQRQERCPVCEAQDAKSQVQLATTHVEALQKDCASLSATIGKLRDEVRLAWQEGHTSGYRCGSNQKPSVDYMDSRARRIAENIES